ncbi:transcription termination factor Rho [Guggenheimella bovis]
MPRDLSGLKLVELRELAKSLEIPSVASFRKQELIEAIEKAQLKVDREARFQGADTVEGFLEEVEGKDFGFLRGANFASSEDDVYVSPVLIRKLNLVTGDKLVGKAKRNNETDRYRAMVYINSVNGMTLDKCIHRQSFDRLTPVHPDKRLRLEHRFNELSTRLIDLFSPVGRGQRGLIVSPPKAGKTVLLQNIARSLEERYKDLTIMMLLIDERPEEVTEMIESIESDVLFSTFDELPSNHIRIAELALARARALASMGHDVIILLDSITRLARAYNLETESSGRTLSGGIDPASLHKPKKFFGSARNFKEGGSITILATALIDTGSRMDEVIFEEFKGTGNMELILTRSLSDKRIFPAIDILKSGTRREEKLYEPKEREFVYTLRRTLNSQNQEQVVEDIVKTIRQTQSNDEFLDVMKKR